MIDNPLQAIDARTLMGTNFPEPVYVVEGLISQGVTFLCGPSKIGKSWLVLWLGLCVAQGQPVWEDYPTRQSEVLYLCLEDNLPRVQRRLAKITDEAPDSLFFATYCGKLGGRSGGSDRGLPGRTPCHQAGHHRHLPEGAGQRGRSEIRDVRQ